MALYEFVCISCRYKLSFIVRSFNAPLEPICRACGSTDLRRALSGFQHQRTVIDIWESSGSAAKDPDIDFYKAPRRMARSVEETFSRLEEDIPKGIQNDIDATREGILPKGLKL